jgi:hypothetical protein
VRIWLTLAVAAMLVYGTVAGQDDIWPFGPFKMYAGYFPPNGVITSTAVMGEHANGTVGFVTQTDTGIPRGDIEGELSQYEANPSRLGDLAAAFHSRFPTASPFVEMRLVQKRWQLHDRQVVGTTVVTLVEWHAP